MLSKEVSSTIFLKSLVWLDLELNRRSPWTIGEHSTHLANELVYYYIRCNNNYRNIQASFFSLKSFLLDHLTFDWMSVIYWCVKGELSPLMNDWLFREKGNNRQQEGCLDNRPCVDKDINPHQCYFILVGEKIKKNIVVLKIYLTVFCYIFLFLNIWDITIWVSDIFDWFVLFFMIKY